MNIPSLKNQTHLVVGGTGQTGHRIIQHLIEAGAKVVATSRAIKEDLPAGVLAHTILDQAQLWKAKVVWMPLNLDLSEAEVEEQLQNIAKILPSKPQALYFAAAFTNVELCEQKPDYCKKVNEVNTSQVFLWAEKLGVVRKIFFSTDYVFDGKDGPYSEEAPRHSICQYGHSKLWMEEFLEKRVTDFLILRTTGVYDYLPGSKNFLMQMLELWTAKSKTRIPMDQFSNPVWAKELAQAAVELAAHGHTGIFHVAGADQLARSEFAKVIAKSFGFKDAIIEEVKTSDLGQKAPRPLVSGLRSEKLERVLGWKPGRPEEIFSRIGLQKSR